MLLRFIPYVGPLLLLQALSACSGENNGAGETNVAANPPAPAAVTAELEAVWIAKKTCGVCGMEQEIGIDSDGDIVFAD